MRGNNNTYMMSTQFGEMKREWRKIYDQAKQWKLKLSVHGRYAGEVSVQPSRFFERLGKWSCEVSSTDAGTRSGDPPLLLQKKGDSKDHVGMWGRETEEKINRNGWTRSGEQHTATKASAPTCPGTRGRHTAHTPALRGYNAPSQEKRKRRPKNAIQAGTLEAAKKRQAFHLITWRGSPAPAAPSSLESVFL